MYDTAFIPYRDRPAIDKGPSIPWTELESGMLFEPLAGSPSLRRVRGVPQFIHYGDSGSPSYMIGSEDETDGRPCGGIIGDANEVYMRHYLDDGRPVYRSSSEIAGIAASDAEIIEALRPLMEAKLATLLANPPANPEDPAYRRRVHVAQGNLTKLKEG